MGELIPLDVPEVADPRLLFALRATEQGGPGREMGVLSVPAPDFTSQLGAAAQTVQNVEQRFAKATGQPPTDDAGRYTPDFLKYFSQGGPGYPGYAPLGAGNDPRNLNANHLPNLLAAYGKETAPRLIPLDEAGNDLPELPRRQATPDLSAMTARGTPPGSGGVIGPTDPRSPWWKAVSTGYENVAGPVRGGVTAALSSVLGPLLETAALPIAGDPRAANPPEVATSLGQRGGELAVPSTLTEAAKQAAVLAAGPYGMAARIAAPSAVEAVSAQQEGRDVLPAAGKTAATMALLEGLGRFIPWLQKAGPGGKQTINQMDVEQLTTAMGNAAPVLRGAPTDAQGLQQFIRSGEAQDRLSAEMDRTATAIEAGLKQQGPAGFGGKLVVPTLGTPENPQGIMSFGDAWKAIGELGRAGYGGSKASAATRDVAGLDPREAWQQATQEVSDQLRNVDPRLAQAWDTAKATYAAGASFIGTLLGKGGARAFQSYPDTVIMNTPYVQKQMAQQEEPLARKIPNWEETMAALRLSPERLGLSDKPSSGPGNMMDTLRMIFNRKGGSAAVTTSPVTTLLPNISGSYVGGNPLATSPQAQTLMDFLGQRAMDEARTRGVRIGPLP